MAVAGPVATLAGVFDDEAGWTALPELLAPAEAVALSDACQAALGAVGDDGRVGDKAHGGTRRLVDLVERVPGVAALAQHPRLLAVVHHLLGPEPVLDQATYRCPQPGFGGQRLHADDVPMLEVGPARCATAIVALTDFTADNGATRLLPGSHRRPDQQRRAGELERHPDEITLVGPAGTAFAFSGHLLHAGGLNRSAAPRPALQLVWRR